jgi:hypothetical protein
MKGAERGWYVASWHPLAWLETELKVVAHVVALVALWNALGRSGWAWPAGLPLVQCVVLAFLALGLTAAIFDRLAEREVIAMAFVILNNLAHWGMVVALTSPPGPGALLRIFAVFMLAGDLVKLVFLRVSGFTVRDTPPFVLYGLTLVYVVGYGVLLLLQALI